jgi:hypothetical protein
MQSRCMTLPNLLLALALLALPALPASLRAQSADSARVGPTARPRSTAAVDTLFQQRRARAKPPISPRNAFLESVLVPGWGQATLHRSTAGGIYVAIEAMSIAMLIQSKKELSAARSAARDSVFNPDSGRFVVSPLGSLVKTRKQAVEDWTALLIFNHLLAGADAFVAAHLWDVPVQVTPAGSRYQATISARVRF